MNGMLTTIDNPFSPVRDYESWLAYDSSLGYNTPSYLARVVDQVEKETFLRSEDSIDEAAKLIVDVDPFSIYKIVYD